MTVEPDPRERRPRLVAPRWRGRRWVVLMTTAAVVAGTLGIPVASALAEPGADPAPAKLAEWARDHGLGDLVTMAEGWRYVADQPTVGGELPGGIPAAVSDPVPAADPAPVTDPSADSGPTRRPAVADQSRLAPLADGTPLPREGIWQTVRSVGARPAVQVAYLRPDRQHTSYVAGVLRMDPALVSGRLHPGTRDPGGHWPETTSLTGWTRANVAVAFNGGFRLTDSSRPGYYSDGRTVAPLVDGRASLLLYRDGHADVRAWRPADLGPDVVSVRQNLLPLVSGGRVNPDCAGGGHREWGDTIGQSAYVDRSGFGVTGDGHEVYAAGPALSVCTLGALLADAGVVRGMELDINPAWVGGAYFTRSAPEPGRPAPDPRRPAPEPEAHKIYPAQHMAAGHYLSASSRDWFAWTLRG